jgi:hypothetical protein
MSKLTDGMQWFKTTFGAQVNAGIKGTPFSLNFLTAIAVQESFEVWGNIYNNHPVDQVLELCVGDTIDGPSRKAFPTSKAALLAIPKGDQIFAAARAALEAVGNVNAAYHKIAMANPNKFCHGFGIFQYDIQACKVDADYFIQSGWKTFAASLQKCLTELAAAQKRAGLGGKTTLSNMEMAFVAIAYNAGSFNPARGLKQGFKDSSGKFYGELIAQYIDLAATVGAPAG